MRRSFRELHRNEDGMMMMVHTVAVMLCVLLIVFTLNHAFSVRQKPELQNAADAGAETVGTVAARHMNALTATQHVMGEVVAMIIVHHAIGGDHLDANEVADTDSVDKALDEAHKGYLTASKAAGLPAEDDAYETVRQEDGVRASEGTTEYDAKVKLKEYLTLVYHTKAAARWMMASRYPAVVAAGKALHLAVHPVELKIKQEYETLNQLHEAAFSLSPLKLYLRDTWLPQAKRYATSLVEEFPDSAADAVQQMGERHDVSIAVMMAHGRLELPVEIDPHAQAVTLLTESHESLALATAGCCECLSERTSIDRDQIVKVTQLARATFPWVNYHRQPILQRLGELCKLVDARKLYKDQTERDSKRICDFLQTSASHDLGLYVLLGYPAPDKANALWTADPDQADLVFATTVLAHRPPPVVLGVPAAFRQAHPSGTVAVAQVLLYNANPFQRPEHPIDLTCKRITPNRQADVGCDTLNWWPGSRPYELIAVTDQDEAPSPEYPRIQINWQAKLVPNSAVMLGALKHNRTRLPGDMATIIERLPDQVPPALLTH